MYNYSCLIIYKNSLSDDRTPFKLFISNGTYGYKTTSGTFVAFRGDSTATYTYASGSTGGTVDMGARNNYRYVNATNVYTKGKSDGVTVHTTTYTFATNDTGGTKDLGTTHTYRYVNAESVYNKGKTDGTTTHTGTYTFSEGSTGSTVDLGTTHTYRYVNATNVYNKGKADTSLSNATYLGNLNGVTKTYTGKVGDIFILVNWFEGTSGTATTISGATSLLIDNNFHYNGSTFPINIAKATSTSVVIQRYSGGIGLFAYKVY